MTPRLARPEEAEPMRALVRAAYAPYVARIGQEPLPMVDDYPARIAADEAWVHEADGAMVGVLVLEDSPEALMLYNIAVADGARGRGHGRAMIAFAEAEARRRGYARLALYTNEKMIENIALYAGLGFRETGRATFFGRRAVFMAKPV